MHDRLRLTQAKMSDEEQLELLAPWYTQDTSESRTLDFFDAIPKYPFSVTTTISIAQRIEAPFTLRGKKIVDAVWTLFPSQELVDEIIGGNKQIDQARNKIGGDRRESRPLPGFEDKLGGGK